MAYHRQRQARKFIHNFLPIGKLNFTLNKKCPYCAQLETKIQPHHYQDHFILCQKHDEKKKILQHIQYDLDSSGLDSDATKTIFTCLSSFFYNTKLDMTSIPPKNMSFVQEQAQIGWRHFIRGRISSKAITTSTYKKSVTKTHHTSPISQIICHTMLKHHIDSWCQYGKARTQQQPDIHNALLTLKDLHIKSQSYDFPK